MTNEKNLCRGLNFPLFPIGSKKLGLRKNPPSIYIGILNHSLRPYFQINQANLNLFFNCNFAWRVWCLCYRWLGVLFVSHIEPESNFDLFRMSLSSESVNIVWNTIWIGAVSEIWNHRNYIVFQRGVADAFEVFVLVQVKVWSWVSTNFRLASFSFSDWCLELMVCMRLVF